MRTSRISALAAVSAATVLAVSLSGCAGGTASGPSGKAGAISDVDGEGKTLTVWVMVDDYNDETLEAINEEFTERTGAEVDIQVQQWDGITTKISTALATATPPDVLDIGNTQVASLAVSGGLLDLTPYQDDLEQGQTWLGGLVDPATVDGSLYAVPGFAGTRSVIYNKTMWAEAGVTSAPTTWDELIAALDKVAAAHPADDFAPLYLPGQNWYAGLQFVWDAGGEAAVEEDGQWQGGLSSDEAQQGLEDWLKFQNTYSTEASRTLDTDTPAQTQLFADGKTSAIIASYGQIGRIKEGNPALTDADFGAFPLPGRSGSTQPVMIGGSVWGIPAKSQNTELALVWTKIAASPSIQSEYVYGTNGWIPNSTEGIEAAQSTLSELQKGFFDAALVSKSTPAAARWADLEADKSINEVFASIASGAKSPQEAAAAFDEKAAATLNK